MADRFREAVPSPGRPRAVSRAHDLGRATRAGRPTVETPHGASPTVGVPTGSEQKTARFKAGSLFAAHPPWIARRPHDPVPPRAREGTDRAQRGQGGGVETSAALGPICKTLETKSGARSRSPERRSCASACKPDSVPVRGPWTAIYLRGLPALIRRAACPLVERAGALRGLAPPGVCPAARVARVRWWALTPPFHPSPVTHRVHRLVYSLLHCAVAGGSPSRASVFTERGARWCPDFPLRERSHGAAVRPTRRAGYGARAPVRARAGRPRTCFTERQTHPSRSAVDGTPRTNARPASLLTSRATRAERGTNPRGLRSGRRRARRGRRGPLRSPSRG